MGQVYSVTTEAEEALGVATVETLVQLRGATTQKARLIEFGVSFDGVTAAAEPVEVILRRQSTDGTGVGATEVLWDPDDPAASLTSFHTFSAEPTGGDRLGVWEVHPQGGLLVMQYPLGREPIIGDAATSRLGLTAEAAAVVNAFAYMVWEE